MTLKIRCEANRKRFNFTRLLRTGKEKARHEKYNRKIYEERN